ncbi:MAG: amidohydrolase family protein [Planctomycetes bacterium]|nr:amidohydrolase family protein [Planctomycetota bacterium]
MKIIDCHVHQSAPTDAKTAADWLERSGVYACHLFSQDPIGKEDGGRGAIENLADIARELPGRILPFAWIDPVHPEAAKIAEWAVRDCGMLGYKMIPTSWYPDDPRAKQIYAVAQELAVPIEFHSGILWLRGDTSKYNRPAGFEALWDFPGVRFSLAHIGWPWTDECIAVVQKFKVLNRNDPERDPFQANVDLTPGTPLVYRKDALAKCVACCGVDFMMFGSDSSIPRSTLPEGKWKRDVDLLREIGCTEEDIEKIFYGNAERFLQKSRLQKES